MRYLHCTMIFLIRNSHFDLYYLYSSTIYCSRDNECFNIEVPKLTYKEIQLVLREIPITDKEYEENKERFHGIGLDEIRKFEKIYRYYPYYTEGCLNT